MINKNKLIFAVIWGIILLFTIFIIINLWNSDKNKTNTSISDFTIWTIWEKWTNFNDVISWFKEIYPNYSNYNIKVETFSDYNDYYYSLISSIISWKSPDLFVLNNNEKNSVFLEQVTGIDPSVISPNDFRKKYKWVFSDDLIETYEQEWDTKEFLVWVPVWYETLGVFYNRKYIKTSDLDSMSSLNSKVAELKKTRSNIVPIAIGNWSTVYNAADIVTQFFLLEDWVSWLSDLAWPKLKQSLAAYLLYWDIDWYNWYNDRFSELISIWQDSLDLFSLWDTYMIVWYPSLINKIDEKWYSKNFLLASAFPHYYNWAWKTLLNYNYFVVNKETDNYQIASDFLVYLYSDIWAENYLDTYSYQLPALLSLESDMLENKIHDDYNVVLKDFYSEYSELSSFDKWVKIIYDEQIKSILDNSSNFEMSFEKFKSNILCKASKISTLEKLSTSCEK